jgi:hypothetical protein
MHVDSKESDGNMSSEEIDFSPASLGNDSSADSVAPMDFEASGLGGVQPDDNFAIKVRRQQTNRGNSSSRHRTDTQRFYSSKIVEALKEKDASSAGHSRSTAPNVSSEIVSTTQKDLPSSSLPPASYLPFDSTSSGEIDDSDADSEESSTSSNASMESGQGPHGTLRLLNLSPTHQRDQAYNAAPASSADTSSNASARGSEYPADDLHSMEPEYHHRVVEEIPAGSSAATAGGGSGFNTPVSGVPPHGQTISAGASSVRSSLKRTRTSDSLVIREGKAHGKKALKSDSSFER